jgi:hypothetical protein
MPRSSWWASPGLPRSELVGLNWEDIEAAPEGLVIAIRRSKTDPEGRGRRIAIPYGRRLCPVLRPGGLAGTCRRGIRARVPPS